MNRSDFIIVALRLFTVYLLVMGFINLPLSFAPLFANMDVLGDGLGDMKKVFIIAISIQGGLYLVACVIVWRVAPRMANIVENGLPQFELQDNKLTAPTLLQVGLIIIGFLTVVKSLPSLVQTLFTVLMPLYYGISPAEISSAKNLKLGSIKLWAEIVLLIFKLLIGTFLILASYKIAFFTRKGIPQDD